DPEEMREEGGEEEARSETEELMAGIWEEVLKVERVGVGANFFEMGGHSLLATQVMSRVREVFGVEVELRKLFEKPTVRGLVESVEEKLGIGRGEKEEGIKRREKEGRVPLSYAQERLWFLEQLEPGSGAYNIPAAIRLRGELNVEALKGSVGRVVERHEALRTVFIEEGGKVRQEVKAEGSVRIEEVDLRSVREEEREEEVKRIGKEEGLKGFDLREGPVLRMKLLRVGEEEHVLVIVLHHIVSDGWSMGVLIREVGELYAAYARGEEDKLEELEIQYSDYAVWQREWLKGRVMEEQLEYWREQLRGAPEVIGLATDHPRPAVQSYRGGRIRFEVKEEVTKRLKQMR